VRSLKPLYIVVNLSVFVLGYTMLPSVMGWGIILVGAAISLAIMGSK
jgi:hypothetical protein